MSDIYHNIKKLIKSKRYITQADIAEKLEVTPNTVSNWMTKNIGLKAEQVPVIAQMFHVSISELYGEEPTQPQPIEISSKVVGNRTDGPMTKKYIQSLEARIAEQSKIIEKLLK